MNGSAIHLAPMSLGDLLDRSVRMYRQDLFPVLGICIGPCLLMFPFEAWLIGQFGPSVHLQVFLDPLASPLVTCLLLINSAVYGAGTAPLIQFVAERHLGGTPGILTSYTRAKGLMVGTAWSYILLSVYGCVPAALVAEIGLTRWVIPERSWWNLVVLVAMYIAIGAVGAMLGMFRVSIAPEALVVEQLSWGRAIRRSWGLMRGNTWRGFVLWLFTLGATWAISFAVGIPEYLLEAWYPGAMVGIGGAITYQISSWLTIPISAIPFLLLYFDTRVRKEGFDISVMADQLDESAPLPGTP